MISHVSDILPAEQLVPGNEGQSAGGFVLL